MRVEIDGITCTVIREPGDPVFRDSGWGSGESRLLYHVKRILNARGYDLIKKRMCRDGHLVDEQMQYLRARRYTADANKNIAIFHDRYAIEGADVPFNRDGKVCLRVVYGMLKSRGHAAVTDPITCEAKETQP